jgi:hypothetical protein
VSTLEVDDRQTAKTQADTGTRSVWGMAVAGLQEEPLIIGATVDQHIRHPLQQTAIQPLFIAKPDSSSDTAHTVQAKRKGADRCQITMLASAG